ncbi:tetratricopeptide repeat protein [bacterium]|nr:tetratricopeptide repeat protein [bacterium]
MKKKYLGIICCLAISVGLSQQAIFSAPVSAFGEHYNAGQDYLMQNQYSSAIAEFKRALRINYMDVSARVGLINSYLARAAYYANQEKNYEKASNDFRSALFYLKIYPDNTQEVQNSVGMISSATTNLNQCLKVMSFDTTSTSRYKKAIALRASGELSAAAYEFYQASQDERLSADANVQIADLLKSLGNNQRSVDFYKLALDLNPNDSELRMKYARTLDKNGQYDLALPEYNSALAHSKGDMEILYSLERIYMKKLAQTPRDAELNANIGAIKQAMGDFDAALNYYGKAEQLNPQNLTTRINVGTLYQQKKDYQKALQAYNSVLTIEPDNSQAMFYKAQTLAEMGDKQTAMNLYRSVATLDPKNTDAKTAMMELARDTMSPVEYLSYMVQNGTGEDLYSYAYKLHKENKIEDAIKAYKAVISKNPNKIDAYVNLGICYAAKDDYDNAEVILSDAKRRFPGNELVAKTLKEVLSDSDSAKMASASASFENKEYKKAIREYLSIEPATENSMLGVAACYQALENYDEAIAYYKKAEMLNPKNSQIPYYIGYLYSEQQNWEQAGVYLNKAIALNPQSEAKQLLNYVNQSGTLGVLNEGIKLYEQKDFEGALAKFNEVLRKESTNAYAYYYRGLINDEKKQPKFAIQDYLNVVKNSNDFPIANYMIAVDYDGLENYKEAFKYYQIFVSKYTTDDEFLRYAKSRMEELRPYAG